MPKLIETELDYDVNESPCGGSHRMVGLCMALNKCKAQGGKIEGGCGRSFDDRVKELVRRAKEYQNADGSLSSEFFVRPSESADIAKAIGAAGHVLEFVLVASDDEQIKENGSPAPCWPSARCSARPRRSTWNAAGCTTLPALHIYRERIFGPISFATELGAKPQAKHSR